MKYLLVFGAGVVVGMILDVVIAFVIVAIESKKELEEAKKKYTGW